MIKPVDGISVYICIKIRFLFFFLEARRSIFAKFDNWLVPVFIWLFAFTASGQAVADSLVAPEIVLYNKASALTDSSKYKDAIPLLKKAVKIKPDYWEAFNLMALAKVKEKDYKNALKDLQKAEKVAPGNYLSLKLRGIAHFHSSNFPQSKQALDSAANVAMEELIDDAELHYYRAQLMFKGNSHKAALEACELALEYKPDYLEVMVLKGEIRLAAREYNYAIRDLTAAIDRMTEISKDFNAYKMRAKARFETGDYKGAVSDWNVYLEENPKEEEALVARGAAKINANDNSGAVADLDEAIKLNNKNAVSYCYRGVAKSGNGAFKEAMKDLDQSIRLKFDYSTAYVNRAAVKMAMKDKRGACEDLQKAESLGSELAIKLVEKYCKPR